MAYPNGVTTSYGYDKDSRLTGIATMSSKQEVLDSYVYTHDKVGNRLSKTSPEEKDGYSYDAVYKLLQSLPTKMHGKDKEQEHKAENYAYDPVGNRMTGPKPKDAAFYNQGNQLVNDRKHQYEYDKNGNLIRKAEMDDDGITKVWTYGYDFENRLVMVTKQEGAETSSVAFKYDPFGRRIEKKVSESEGGKVETKTYAYVYDNEDVIMEYLTKTEDGKTRTDVTRYLHGPGIDEPLSIDRKGEIYYYHADGLGSVTALTDKKQKVVESYEYDSFGNLKRHGDKVKNTFTYTGREYDKETGLYYYRARYYDPQAGRFTQKDPIGFAGGDVNLFSYVGQNPVRYVDPRGLMALEFLGKLLSKMKFLGLDEQGAAIGGKIGDSLVGAGTTIAGASVVPCSTRKALGSTLDIIQAAGGIQSVSLGIAIVSTSSVNPLLPAGLAAAGGVELGDAFNQIYERLSGQSLGEDIYDVVHPLTR